MSEIDLFIATLRIASPAERSAFLARECGDDVVLKQRINALLLAHEQAGSFLTSAIIDPPPESPGPAIGESDRSSDEPRSEPALDRGSASGAEAFASADRASPAIESPGAWIGPYKLVQRIGEGGMGVVYLAEQEKPVRRKVALKIIKPGMDTAQVVARFEAERQALAILDHPSIAKVFDAGATSTGRPYFVMELVKGVPITAYCDAVQLCPKERLELFIPVCEAIQHAHQKGIIHRDVKPSNVLIAMQDGKPVPKIIDFGIAKATEQRLTEKSLFTQQGTIVGTFEYMSPEQAQMSAMDVDTRTDIYALGVLLYELLTGTTPLERAQLRQSGYTEILKRIREEEPPKPSTRLFESKATLPSVAAQRKTDPSRLPRLMRGDLDWIVMKSLEKDRTRRYETANGFARDVQRYLDGDTVEACPPSAWYRLKKLASRHRASLVTTGAFVILLVAATVISFALAVDANRERAHAHLAMMEAQVQRRRAEEREQMAIDAVKRFRDAVVDEPALKNSPALEPLRKKLLKEPLSFYKSLREQFQADNQTKPEALKRLGKTATDLAQLTDDIGDKEDALKAVKESLLARERLVRDNPASTDFQADLAESYNTIGKLQLATGRLAEARQSLERGRAILERMVRENPSVARFLGNLASSYHNIGALEQKSGRQAEALANFERARAIRERLVRENPTVTQFQNDLASSYNSIGVLQSETGRPAEAQASLERARAIREHLTRGRSTTSEEHQ
jgi:serine/threonine protein kinase